MHDDAFIDLWAPDRFEFDAVTLPKLMKIGKDIGDRAKAGCLLSTAVIHWYARLRDSFDPVTHQILKEAITKWEQHANVQSSS